MATVGYARVSTSGQSLDTQLEALTGCEKVFQEKASAKEGNERLALINLLDYIREGDRVVVTKLDRLARSMRDFVQIHDALKAKGAELQIQNMGLDTGTAQGQLMLSVLMAVAEFELDLRRERQMEGIAEAKRQGRHLGRPGISEAQKHRIIELDAEGAHTRQQIAEAAGVSVASVYNVIRQEREAA